MQLASFSLAEVTYATGDISYLVQEQAKLASFRVKTKQENVSGVVLPAFEVDRVAGTGTVQLAYIPFITSSSQSRFQSYWLGAWRSTSTQGQRSICKSTRNASGACVASNRVYDPGRSHPCYQQKSERY